MEPDDSTNHDTGKYYVGWDQFTADTMPSHSDQREHINGFLVSDHLLFKQYFDSEEVFDLLKRYYNNQQYRFEIPQTEVDRIQKTLADFGYELLEVETIEPFIVVVQKYSRHPDNIFKHSIIHRGQDGYNVFLLKDEASVRETVQEHATRFTATDLDNPFLDL